MCGPRNKPETTCAAKVSNLLSINLTNGLSDLQRILSRPCVINVNPIDNGDICYWALTYHGGSRTSKYHVCEGVSFCALTFTWVILCYRDTYQYMYIHVYIKMFLQVFFITEDSEFSKNCCTDMFKIHRSSIKNQLDAWRRCLYLWFQHVH